MELIKFRQNVCKPCTELDLYLEHGVGVKADATYIIDDNDMDKMEIAQDKASDFGIMSTPVLVLLDDNGVEIDRVIGIERTAVNRILSARGLL